MREGVEYLDLVENLCAWSTNCRENKGLWSQGETDGAPFTAEKTQEFGVEAICLWEYRELGLERTLFFSPRVEHWLGFLPPIRLSMFGPVTPEREVFHCVSSYFDVMGSL